MKFKLKGIVTLILIFVFILNFCPVIPLAEDAILSYDFEQEGSTDSWAGALRDVSCAYSGQWGINVSNPYGDDESGIYGHILSYDSYIHLEEGKFYTFSAYVTNPLAEYESEPSASAYIGRGGTELFIDISGIGSLWQNVTACFMATETVDIPLVITFEAVTSDIGVFVDEIEILPEARTPAYSVLEGPDSVFIPQNGYTDYRYSIVTYDTDYQPINILTGSPVITASSLPEGVEFDEDSGKLRVYSTVVPNESFTILYSASIDIEIDNAEKVVTTTKNLLSDPSFNNGEENWSSSVDIDFSGNFAELYAAEQGTFGYFASITYTKQLLLHGGHMYVFRADVGSEPDFPSSSVYVSNLSFAQSGYAEINITGIGGEWNAVTSAFIIEDTGLYDLTLNLFAPTERPIYLDNVYLGIEEEAATSISIHAPGHIQAPSNGTILPCFATVRNQMGESMDNLESMLTVEPEGEGVYLEDNNVIIEPGCTMGDYTIVATYDEIVSVHTITVSTDAIGDGGFEQKQPNEWWTASDGAFFTIFDYNGSKAGHVYSPETTCILINNSYMEIIEGENYVYSAAAGFGEGTVTAFIADHETGEYIPFAQYSPTDYVKVPFSLDKSVLGRLVLYIESDDSIGVLFDDIAILPAELTATEVTVTGGTYGDFLRGSYVYVNNMTDDADADISTTRWYISSSPDGHYEPIGVPNRNYLEFTADMAGQYIVFEVTPVCLYSGIVGDSVRSHPIKVEQIPDGENSTEDNTVMAPVELDISFEHQFTDITAHWAEEMISSLAASGIVSGRTSTRFVPGYNITRAEFTTMVARAFSLVSVPYSGTFSDVSASDWYAGWVEAAYRRGIVTGKGDSLFDPNGNITREEMAAIIIRAYLLCDGPLPYELDLKYYDEFLISDWAYDSVKMCTNLNLFTGDDMNLFRPKDFATRAEAAACIYRALKSF